jgi:hypothetical protein
MVALGHLVKSLVGRVYARDIFISAIVDYTSYSTCIQALPDKYFFNTCVAV